MIDYGSYQCTEMCISESSNLKNRFSSFLFVFSSLSNPLVFTEDVSFYFISDIA